MYLHFHTFFNHISLLPCIRKITVNALFPCLLYTLVFIRAAGAATVEYTLTIAKQDVNITGKSTEAMTINGDIPGPVLRFREGDLARINVRNTMDVDSSIHWHGILVPPGMDGVPYISFPPIAAGTTFTYEFPIRQSGTYWYHSHTGLQEQRGVYGSIVIEAQDGGMKHHRDHVILFSDWTDEKPQSVNRTLKRGSEWYALEKGSGQSILGAAKLGMLGSYFQREFMRMPPMDISDVAYDRFLANGSVDDTLQAVPDETIRLRIINGSATTYFHVEFSGGPMTIVAADGIDVSPVQEERLLVGVAETYDMLITLPPSGSCELRATAHDGSGHASVWLGEGMRHPAREVPKPNLYQPMHHAGLKQAFALTPAGSMGMPDNMVDIGMFDKPGMMDMGHGSMPEHEMKMEHSDTSQMDHTNQMDHSAGMKNETHETHMQMPESMKKHTMESMQTEVHSMPDQVSADRSGRRFGTNFGFLATDISSRENLAVDGMDPERPLPPYAKLRATQPTAFGGDRKVREIRLALDGDMERYIWSFNNKTLAESDSIRIREGEIARFIMINRTMMHHPIHLHGHFFRVVNGQGDFAPLKHTVDVAPMSTTVIEFDANEVGDWFFHCHLLYHMKAGMTRVVHYEDFPITPELEAIRPKVYKDPWYFWGEADILSNMTEGMLTLSNTRNIVTAFWEVGWENVDQTEWEGILSWDRYFNRFFTLFAGVNMHGEESSTEETRGVFGFHYLLPLNFESRTWIDTDGGSRVSLEKSLELTPRLSLVGEVRYDTHDLWEGKAGLTYMVHKNFSVSALWHSDYAWGAGLQIRF